MMRYHEICIVCSYRIYRIIFPLITEIDTVINISNLNLMCCIILCNTLISCWGCQKMKPWCRTKSLVNAYMANMYPYIMRSIWDNLWTTGFQSVVFATPSQCCEYVQYTLELLNSLNIKTRAVFVFQTSSKRTRSPNMT